MDQLMNQLLSGGALIVAVVAFVVIAIPLIVANSCAMSKPARSAS
jgi:hypothetical protein